MHFSHDDLAEAFELGHEICEAYIAEGKSRREAAFYADSAVAVLLGIPVHKVSQVMSPARVRRETFGEAQMRRSHQLPHTDDLQYVLDRAANGINCGYTVNEGLIPGEAKFVSEVTMTANPQAKGYNSLSPHDYRVYLEWDITPTDLRTMQEELDS